MPVDDKYRHVLEERNKVFTDQLGFNGATVTVLDVQEFAPGYAMVPTRWTMDFAPKAGDPAHAEFEQTYLISTVTGEPKILFYVSHVSQADEMQRLGLA
jgi:hypothetical protein